MAPVDNSITSSTIADIDAVKNHLSPAARLEAYKLIASRRGLKQKERDYMVETVTADSISQAAKDEILTMLVSNPSYYMPALENKKSAARK